MTFPESPYESVEQYLGDYFESCAVASRSVSGAAITRAAEVLTAAYQDGRIVYACGNGGSAAISNHLLCDHAKGIRSDTGLMPRVVSLANNVELMTAIANDIAYQEVYLHQLQNLARPQDVLVAISSSGDSENIVRAVAWAKKNDVRTIVMTGFSGGRAGDLAEVHLHVSSENYGVIEDVHQSLMHILAQFIRQAHMTEDQIRDRTF